MGTAALKLPRVFGCFGNSTAVASAKRLDSLLSSHVSSECLPLSTASKTWPTIKRSDHDFSDAAATLFVRTTFRSAVGSFEGGGDDGDGRRLVWGRSMPTCNHKKAPLSS